VPSVPRPRLLCSSDQTLQFGELIYWNGAFLKERARYNDAPTPMSRDQFVEMALELASATFRQLLVAHGLVPLLVGGQL